MRNVFDRAFAYVFSRLPRISLSLIDEIRSSLLCMTFDNRMIFLLQNREQQNEDDDDDGGV